jgi:2-hydroxy-3-keto-5-methylthiopentenyl-1-phosphate phosphatase
LNKFAFVSDFDGTLTQRDFYYIVMDKYMKARGWKLYEEWKETKKIDTEFLNMVFASFGKSEDEIFEDIIEIPLDEHAVCFIERIKSAGGRFFILSAGTSYYIDILLTERKIEGVQVISMKGEYIAGGIRILPDKNSPYFSEVFGLDKRKVVEDLKKEFEVVFFAGDSEPDLGAAKAADVAFAKGDLKDLLQKDNTGFVPFDQYIEIDKYMTEKGWLNDCINE